MKALIRMVLLLPPLLLAASANVSNAESPPSEAPPASWGNLLNVFSNHICAFLPSAS